jgi:hypothetical protein
MNNTFEKYLEHLDTKYHELMSMQPVGFETIPQDTPVGGVYLFSKDGKNLYVGRTKRKIGARLKDHVSTADDCPFAFRLARENTGHTKPSYTKSNGRKSLLKNPTFRKAYDDAKKEIRRMDIRYVGEVDPVKQALLEIYVAIVTGAKHNDFDTH